MVKNYYHTNLVHKSIAISLKTVSHNMFHIISRIIHIREINTKVSITSKRDNPEFLREHTADE